MVICSDALPLLLRSFGGQVLMDDANIPSPLSLPYLGFVNKTDSVYAIRCVYAICCVSTVSFGSLDRPPTVTRISHHLLAACSYQATRALVLSEAGNPYFFRGTAGEGIGGPHVGALRLHCETHCVFHCCNTRRFRFTLRTRLFLLCLVSFLCCLLTWLASWSLRQA